MYDITIILISITVVIGSYFLADYLVEYLSNIVLDIFNKNYSVNKEEDIPNFMKKLNLLMKFLTAKKILTLILFTLILFTLYKFIPL